jgi:hypothetical protein
MRGRASWLAVAIAAAALMVPAAAAAGNVTLHPSGFGEHSYSAWKGKEGLADRKGGGDHALYFQKMTTTPTFAAGVAVFNNVFIPIEELQGLEFWVGTDGHCGAGAPRFNLRLQNRSTGAQNTVFIGCAEMIPGATAAAPNGRVFQQRTFTGPVTACCGPLPASGFDIVSLAIVFDEGNDVGQGFVHLDNILVQSDGFTKCWTGPADNSANNSGPCPAPNTTLSPLAEPLLFVDPAVQLAALAAAMPEVAVTSWVLYPYPL